jgi:hypothetical protein
MKCNVCGKDKNGMCLCGFCQDCIKEHGHDGCHKIMEDRKNAERSNA